MDMIVQKNMTVGDLKAKFMDKLEVGERSLICCKMNSKDVTTMLDDKHLLDDINPTCYYTMIYEVDPSPELEIMLKLSFWEDRGNNTVKPVEK